MTRNPPQGGFPTGNSYNNSNHQQQQQYGGNYGQEQSYNQVGYNNQQQPYSQNSPPTGSAQSYYGQNDQPYQQYPNDSAYGSQAHQSGPHTPQPSYQQPQQPYGQYQNQAYPPYGQAPQAPYYPSDQPGGSEVDDFRSHFDQPHGSINPNPAPYPPQQQPQELGYTSVNPSQAADEDRGVMGAMAGGAAGAFAGHKVHHGFLGGIGGAIGGSMLEDAYKKKHKKEEKEKKDRRGSHSSSSSSNSDRHHHSHHGGGPAVMAGNFSASSRGMRLEGRSMLVSECCDVNGHHREARIDLNDCFTNSNGELLWARGGNFAASARHARLEDGGRVLETELGDGNGGWRWQRVRLDERISNEDGRLVMI